MLEMFTKRSTFKLAFIYYADRLLMTYSEYLVKELCNLHRYFVRKKNMKELKRDHMLSQIFTEVTGRVYLLETFKKLKDKKEIDRADYESIVSELNLN